jgi:hypothetical protein
VSPSPISDQFVAAISGCSIDEAMARRAAMMERWLAGEKF